MSSDSREPDGKAETIELNPVFPKSSGPANVVVDSTLADKINTPPTAVPERTVRHRWTEQIHLFTLYWTLLLAGWNDASTGPLLPRIQKVYHLGFTVVSILFVTACCGFLIGAFVNIRLTNAVGFGKTMMIGAIFQCLGYIVQSTAPPFPVLCLGYSLNGIGMAVQDAQANGYVAELQEHAATKMGILHAAYGAGAFLSPLVATQFAQLPHWSFHYLTSLGIAIINLAATIWVFRGRRQEELMASIGQVPHESQSDSEVGSFTTIARTRNVHLLAFFILVYVGVEVTTGGWIVTFILDKREGGPSSGYVSSGFFGGLTVGRVALLWVNHKIGEYKVIYLYSLLGLGLEIVIWFTPSLIANAIAVSIIGVLLGPMYPIVMNHSARILPRWILTGSIGWIAGFGQAGSALIPFATGALAGRFGIGSLQPFMVANICAMAAFWAIVPSKHGRTD